MRVGVLGINYKCCPIELREAFAKASSRYFGVEGVFTSRYSTVLLSTCNRVEIYFSSEDLEGTFLEIKGLLKDALEAELDFYHYMGKECFEHLAQVTSGLDSAIIAETEIQNQVKKTYLNFSKKYPLAKDLHYLFQKSLKVAKEVRSRLFIPKGLPNLEKTLFKLYQDSLDTHPHTSGILFYGNSDINKRIIRYFALKGVHNISLCTHYKSVEVEEELKPLGVSVYNWEEASCWCHHHLVVLGTNYESFILKRENKNACHSIQTKLICDLSVPRNVDPALAKELNIPLYNIEDLSLLVSSTRISLLKEVEHSREFLNLSVERSYNLFINKIRRGVLCA